MLFHSATEKASSLLNMSKQKFLNRKINAVLTVSKVAKGRLYQNFLLNVVLLNFFSLPSVKQLQEAPLNKIETSTESNKIVYFLGFLLPVITK